MRGALAAAVVSCAALLPDFSLAETRIYRSEYSISAFGLPIGRSTFEAKIAPDAYEMTGTLKARGLLALFQPTTGSVSVNGRIDADRVEARKFTLNYISGDETQRTEIAFSDGGVASTLNEPKVNKRQDWIDVTAAQFKDALDPVSALLLPADTPGEVCNRTLRVYDGAMRLDVRLSYLRTIPFSVSGKSGEAITCRARFKPVSGYNGDRKQIAWLRDKGRMDISFAAVEGTRLYAPLKATVATQVGPVRVFATRFQVSAR